MVSLQPVKAFIIIGQFNCGLPIIKLPSRADLSRDERECGN